MGNPITKRRSIIDIYRDFEKKKEEQKQWIVSCRRRKFTYWESWDPMIWESINLKFKIVINEVIVEIEGMKIQGDWRRENRKRETCVSWKVIYPDEWSFEGKRGNIVIFWNGRKY